MTLILQNNCKSCYRFQIRIQYTRTWPTPVSWSLWMPLWRHLLSNSEGMWCSPACCWGCRSSVELFLDESQLVQIMDPTKSKSMHLRPWKSNLWCFSWWDWTLFFFEWERDGWSISLALDRPGEKCFKKQRQKGCWRGAVNQKSLLKHSSLRRACSNN